MVAKSFLIGGAGFSGAVLARLLAEAGHHCEIVEARAHVAGNCHTARDPETGVMVHHYGPHIFHTDNRAVWDFVNRHATMRPYRHRVFSRVGDQIYSLPINLHTINQFFGKTFSPSEARAHIERLCEFPPDGSPPKNFETQALALIGRDLYEAFFKGYTLKQWGVDPRDLPASILKRLPLRFIYDDNYFFHPFQGIPENGYTELVLSVLDHPNIKYVLQEKLTRGETAAADHVFFTGTIDGWFGYEAGRLAYRTLDFESFREKSDFQGCAVMNYADSQTPFTRITEHKHFASWETHAQTICFKEFSRACTADDIPYYPVRLVEDQALLSTYLDKARAEKNISFLGRLGTYRYLDMDVAIGEAMLAAQKTLSSLEKDLPIPVFFHEAK